MQDLDLKDRKILYELDRDSSQSLSSIAKKVGLSKEVVNYRIKTLQEKQVLEGFYTIINTSKLGFYTVRVYLKFQSSIEEQEEEMLNQLANLNESLWVARTTGPPWDVAFGIWAKDLNHFDKLWLNFEKKYRNFISDKQVSIFLNFKQFDRSYLIDKPKEHEARVMINETNKEEIDEKDFKILQIISNDARISLMDLSKHLDQTPNAVKYRIKQLEKKKIIAGYSAKINLSKLGYIHYKVDMNLNDLSKLPALMSIISSHPNIIYYERTIGASDFEFDLEVKDAQQFRDIIKNIKIELKGAVRNYTYYISRTIYKIIYLPSTL